MASTSNKNTPGNYLQEQKAYEHQLQYSTNKEYGVVDPTYRAGKGLIQGRLPDTELAKNPTNIESWLFGIGATNLVNPQPPLVAEVRNIPALSIVDREPPLVMPQDLVIPGDQRPFPIPKK